MNFRIGDETSFFGGTNLSVPILARNVSETTPLRKPKVRLRQIPRAD
jgi:hypothetical protein